MDPLVFHGTTDLEIDSFDYRYNDIFEGEMVVLCGSGQASLSIRVQCRSVRLAPTAGAME